MKKIPLSRGLFAIVDDDAPDEITKHNWVATSQKKPPVYAVRTTKENGKSKTIRMHRVVIGAKNGQYVDHINRNSLDNRIENLRIATNSQNQANRGAPANSTTGIKGVSLIQCRKTNKPYMAGIEHNGKRFHLGYYSNAKDAKNAYVKKCVEIFGEYASCQDLPPCVEDTNERH